MTVAVYPLTLAKFWQGLIDAAGGTVVCAALSSGYTYSGSDEFADAVTASVLGTPATVSSKDFTGGVFTADNPSITGTSGGDVVVSLVYYIDTGTDSTSPLLVFVNENGDGSPISYVSDGNPITVALQSGTIASI